LVEDGDGEGSPEPKGSATNLCFKSFKSFDEKNAGKLLIHREFR
jgi:hypothetical protein